MKSTKKELGKSGVKLIISVSPEEMEAHFEEEFLKIAPSVTIPGFRSGMAPRVMLIESIGHSRISQLALEKAINENFQKALMEHGQMPVNEPSISISKYPAFGEDKSKNELVFEAQYDVISNVKIGDYKKIKLSKNKASKTDLDVTDEEVEGVIGYLRRQRSTLSDKSGKSEKGDWLEVSFKGTIKSVVIEKLTSDNMPLVLGETKLIPGFEEKIIGIKKGEKREFEISFAKDFIDKELSGKTAKFSLECLGVKKVELPKMDKAFFEAFGLTSEKELRSRIKGSLVQEKKDREFEVKRNEIAQELIKITKAEIPSSLVKKEVDRMKSALQDDLKSRGLTLDKYQESLKIDDKKMQKDLEDQSKKNITLGLALAEVAKAEKINVSNQEGIKKLYERLFEILGL